MAAILDEAIDAARRQEKNRWHIDQIIGEANPQ